MFYPLVWAFLLPSIAIGQIDTLEALPESPIASNPHTASPRLKSNYFLAEAKYQEGAFQESQQLFQKLIDSFQKTESIKGNPTQLSSTNNDAQFISGAYYRLSQLSTDRNMALFQLDLALKYAPKNKDYLFAKAQLHEKSNNWLEAIKIYNGLCTLDPHSWTFHEKTANAYFEYLPQILNGQHPATIEKSKQKRNVSVKEIQIATLSEFQTFTDSWEKHFSLSPSIVETKLYILWCQSELKLISDTASIHYPASNPQENLALEQKFNSMIPTRITQWMDQNNFTNHRFELRRKNDVQPKTQIIQSNTMENTQIPMEVGLEEGKKLSTQELFLQAIHQQNWILAFQLADTLENRLHIFTAKDLVKGFMFLTMNQVESALETCKNGDIESNPFVVQTYLLLKAKSTSIKARQQLGGELTPEQVKELSSALVLWQKLYEQKAMNQTNDINEAIAISMLLKNQEWVNRFQQLASDLNTTPSKPIRK